METARPRSRSIQREYSTTSMTDGVMNRGNVEGENKWAEEVFSKL